MTSVLLLIGIVLCTALEIFSLLLAYGAFLHGVSLGTYLMLALGIVTPLIAIFSGVNVLRSHNRRRAAQGVDPA